MRAFCLSVAVLSASLALLAQQNARPEAILDRAIADFESGRFTESLAAFDDVIKAAPAVRPQLWQRGIALYYAGRFSDCRAQFELHRTVNPDDVENAAWHFLCVARGESPEKARAALLPVGPDPRLPMREIYEMLRGTLTPDEVINAAGGSPSAQFYALLYAGLYFDATGQPAMALDRIRLASVDRFAAIGGYMHMVARVHVAARTGGRR